MSECSLGEGSEGAMRALVVFYKLFSPDLKFCFWYDAIVIFTSLLLEACVFTVRLR